MRFVWLVHINANLCYTSLFGDAWILMALGPGPGGAGGCSAENGLNNGESYTHCCLIAGLYATGMPYLPPSEITH